MRGKSINLYLMDGTSIGRIKCTLSNWTGLAYKIPRTEVEKSEDRKDLKQSGVYFLFGESEETGESVVYIGQAGTRKIGEGLLNRLKEHKSNSDKSYWIEAIAFTTSNNSFGPTEISYLENRFYLLATEAKRYIVKNAIEPTSGNVTEEKESELEEYLEYAKIVMGALGHKVFEPIEQVLLHDSSIRDGIDEKQLLYCKSKVANAIGRVTSEGFLLMAGSVISKTFSRSCPDWVKNSRKKYETTVGESGKVETSILFKSPSAASAFVLGRSSNGLKDWKTKEGMSLKDLE